MSDTLKNQVIELLMQVNGMTKPQAIYKTSKANENDLYRWKKELKQAKKQLEANKKEHTLDLSRSTFRKITTVNDLKEWLIYITTQTNISGKTPIKMYSDEEGNQVNGILALDYQDIGLVIIPLEE